ncbi:hypothetical protein PN499_04650 [Kamptonema animale CS-326]|jgi:hypothetical protein|uniref:hypothetical protein n=1 Tax=Kamptonema animale TaxID=92934 RepID=UPI00233033FD|nr:hypothetical protein [Kamptonema animale]MDB9510468.1 hypothetical protein [Kamptonema animale CS-326]
MVKSSKMIFINGLKLGISINIIFLIIIGSLSCFGYLLGKPLSSPRSRLPLGTVTGFTQISNSIWRDKSQLFSFFIIENELNRAVVKKLSSKTKSWCKYYNCYSHRMSFNDVNKLNFSSHTIDDFYTDIQFTDAQIREAKLKSLDLFLASLPSGSLIIINEPIVFFKFELRFTEFKNWYLSLVDKYPNLKFQFGLQIHLQWLDVVLFRYNWLFDRLKDSNLEWMVIEFSIYDELWKKQLSSFWRELSDFNVNFPPVVDKLVPRFVRSNLSLLSAYYVASKCRADSNCKSFVIWGNFGHAWFADRVPVSYSGQFQIFDESGKIQPMYWAILRGLNQ